MLISPHDTPKGSQIVRFLFIAPRSLEGQGKQVAEDLADVNRDCNAVSYNYLANS